MRFLIQRVLNASVSVLNEQISLINKGLLIFVGIEQDDTINDIQWLVNKAVQLRIFNDDNGKMNYSLLDINADILLVSQFTLHASTKKGNRPSFIQSANPGYAKDMYMKTIVEFEKTLSKSIQTGQFGADMKVLLLNDGPVTIWLDSKNVE